MGNQRKPDFVDSLGESTQSQSSQKTGEVRQSPDRPPDGDENGESGDTPASQTEEDAPRDHTRQRSDTPMRDDRTELDYSPASGGPGASEHNYDAEAPLDHDGRSQTQTTFYGWEVDHPEIDYERLAKLNDGKFANDIKDQRRHTERLQDLQIVAEELRCSDRVIERARQMLDNVDDVRQFQSDEVVVVTVLTLAANEHGTRLRDRERFDEMCKMLGITRSRVRKAREQWRQEDE